MRLNVLRSSFVVVGLASLLASAQPAPAQDKQPPRTGPAALQNPIVATHVWIQGPRGADGRIRGTKALDVSFHAQGNVAGSELRVSLAGITIMRAPLNYRDRFGTVGYRGPLTALAAPPQDPTVSLVLTVTQGASVLASRVVSGVANPYQPLHQANAAPGAATLHPDTTAVLDGLRGLGWDHLPNARYVSALLKMGFPKARVQAE